MAIDITLFTEMPVPQLREFLEKSVSASQFRSYDDWKEPIPPGRFDAEILEDVGVKLNVQSKATFRVRKETIEQEYNFLKSLLEQCRIQKHAVMLLNGEDLLFEMKE